MSGDSTGNSDHRATTTTDRLLAAANITVTEQGMATTAARLRKARESFTAEVRARLHDQVGLPRGDAAA